MITRQATGVQKNARRTPKCYLLQGYYPRLRGDEFTSARDPALREPKAGAMRRKMGSGVWKPNDMIVIAAKAQIRRLVKKKF